MSFAEKHRLLFERSPTAIVVLDADGRIRDANPATVELLGRNRDRILGVDIDHLVIPADRQRAETSMGALLTGSEESWSMRLARGDGLPRLVEIAGMPLEEGGEIQGALCYLTPSYKEEDPTRAQLVRLLRNLPDQYSVILDSDGRIRSAKGLSRLLYRDEVEIVGSKFSELLVPGPRTNQMLSEMIRASEEGTIWSGRIPHLRADGSEIGIELFATAHVEPLTGRRIGHLVAGRSEAEEVDLRQRLKRSERLSSLGSVTVAVAREFDRRLVAQTEELARIEGSTDQDRSAIRNLDSLREEMRRIVSAVTEFAVPSDPEPREFSVERLIESVVEDRRSVSRLKGLRLEVDVDSDVPTMLGDSAQIRRILEILLDNAEENTSHTGERRVRIRLQSDDDSVFVAVEDSGTPIPREWEDRIFEPFFTTKDGHLGLGLSVARGIAQAHGGRIWHRTLEQAGETVTRFGVTLPVFFEGRVQVFRTTPLRIAQAQSILVVDDEEDIRISLRKFLERVGYTVREAWSGRSALAQLTSAQPPHVILTDLNMADGTGQWLLSELERDFPRLLDSTVILTGNVDPFELDRLHEDTGCPVLQKPFEPSLLLEVVDRVALHPAN